MKKKMDPISPTHKDPISPTQMLGHECLGNHCIL